MYYRRRRKKFKPKFFKRFFSRIINQRRKKRQIRLSHGNFIIKKFKNNRFYQTLNPKTIRGANF